MNLTSILITSSVVVAIGAGTVYLLNILRKRNMEKLFTQVYDMSRNVPKQKKHAFLLMMFRETLTPKKKRSPAFNERLNNPKFLEVQLISMTNVLKDPTNVKDKILKRAIVILNDYVAWEKKKTPRPDKIEKNEKTEKKNKIKRIS